MGEPQPLTVRSGLGFGNAPDQNGAHRAVGRDVFLVAVWIGAGWGSWSIFLFSDCIIFSNEVLEEKPCDFVRQY